MDWWYTLLILFGSLLFLMFLGLPVAFSFFFVTTGAVYALMGGVAGLNQLIASIYDSLTKFNLTAIPFFILMGEILYHAGLVTKALDVFSQWVGRIPGRLSVVTFLVGGLFGALSGGVDWLHAGSLWTTALALTLLARMGFERYYFSGWSKAQEARKARFTRLRLLERLAAFLPISVATRQLFLKDLKVFLRDTAQWSQLLLLLALAVVYVYNFRVLDLDRIPYMGFVIRNLYAFLNLLLAGFVLSAVAVRFVFPAVSAEGPAFWIVRSSPVSMRAFLWSKFWTGLPPVLVLAFGLTVVSNRYLGARPFLQVVCAVAVVFMSFALVGLAAGMGARHPRFSAENLTQVAGSYGGVAFMVLAVLFLLAMIVLLGVPTAIYLGSEYNRIPLTTGRRAQMALAFATAAGLSVFVFLRSMRSGVRALEEVG
jgi:ABC-2 type transport system permease protein